jgi:alcohol dehydrogenase
MRFNLPERAQHLAKIAEWLDVDISGTTRETAAHRAIDRVVQMQQQIGIPQRIRDLGGKEEQLPMFAAKAFQVKRLLATNPSRGNRG